MKGFPAALAQWKSQHCDFPNSFIVGKMVLTLEGSFSCSKEDVSGSYSAQQLLDTQPYQPSDRGNNYKSTMHFAEQTDPKSPNKIVL